METGEKKDHLEDLCVDGRIISKWISRKTVGRVWSGLILPRIE